MTVSGFAAAGAAAGRIGYNVSQTKTLMQNIEACYNSLGTTIQSEWETVQATLKSNWVGEDEQDFEDKLAKRISEMYTNTYNLCNNSLSTIFNLAKAWHEFQQKNKIEGSNVGSSSFGLEELQVSPKDSIVQAKIETIGDDVDRGLVNPSSASAITQSLEKFKTTLQSKITEMIDAISVNSAFFGEQAGSIKKYVEKVGDGMAEIITAIKDLYVALETLAGTSYTTASSDVAGKMDEGVSNIETSLGDLGDTRWV